MLVSQDVSGPVPAQRRHTRSAFRTATPVLSVEEGQRALVASLKSLQQPRRGDGRVKRRPLRGAPLSIPSRPLLPDLPSPSYLPMRPKRPGTMLDHCAWPTDNLHADPLDAPARNPYCSNLAGYVEQAKAAARRAVSAPPRRGRHRPPPGRHWRSAYVMIASGSQRVGRTATSKQVCRQNRPHVSRRVARCARRATAPTGCWLVSWPGTMVEHHPRPLRPHGQVGRRGQIGQQGSRRD
jgi:hypothetical protein